VIMQFESNAFVAFCNAAKAAAVLYAGADPNSPLLEHLEPLLDEHSERDTGGLLDLLASLESGRAPARQVTLDDVAALRTAADSFMLDALTTR
jgi:hypothetical protein